MTTLLRALLVAALALLALAGAAADALTRRQVVAPARRSRTRLVIRTVYRTIVALIVLSFLGGFAYMYSGLYNIAALEPHLPPVRWALETGRTRSVQFHSRNLVAPPLRDEAMVREGFVLYRENCEPCHGAPGVPREQLGIGINPTPPPLMTTIADWTDPQLYWIINNGLKMSGMPAFGEHFSERQTWSVVAFLHRMAWLSPADYARMARADDGSAQAVAWLPEDDRGLARLQEQGDRRRGRALLRSYGCASCHVIPGVRDANSHVGPPLAGFAERHFIAGSLPNTPADLVAFIVDPAGMRPRTAMPDVQATPEDALDMAAYLFSLGQQRRVNALQRTLQD